MKRVLYNNKKWA